MIDIYRAFDLSTAEISLISNAVKKRDYSYTSALGSRLFQLILGELTLGIIGGADHKMLDNLVKNNIRGAALLKEVLSAKNIDYQQYVDFDVPQQTEFPAPEIPAAAASENETHHDTNDMCMEEIKTTTTLNAAQSAQNSTQALFEALLPLPTGRKKADKKGRTAEGIAAQFGISPTTVYMVKALLKSGESKLIDEVKTGNMSIKNAHKKLKEKNNNTDSLQ